MKYTFLLLVPLSLLFAPSVVVLVGFLMNKIPEPLVLGDAAKTDARNLVVFVHGMNGNAKELAYLMNLLKPVPSIYVHAVTSNEGNTSDGIDAGGQRLAEEMNEFIAEHGADFTTISFVCHSLGGLYARYALATIDLGGLRPLLFATTATPHLGCKDNTFVSLPERLNYLAAKVTGKSMQDLFHITDVVPKLFEPPYIDKLAAFEHRVALANAHNTDFFVPIGTALFLNATSNVRHTVVPLTESATCPNSHSTTSCPNGGAAVVLKVTTERREAKGESFSETLDNLGWTKWVCDVRPALPKLVSRRRLQKEVSQDSETTATQDFFTSQDILAKYGKFRPALPFGHSVLIVNSKRDWYAKANAGGAPIMGEFAEEIQNSIVSA